MTQGGSREDRTKSRVEHGVVQGVRAVPSLAALDDAETRELAGASANLVWAAGSVVLARGSAADGLYVLLSGRVRVLDDGGRELAALGPGEVLGEFSLVLGTPRQYDVVAAEDTELMIVPKGRIQQLLADRPELAATIRSQLEARQAANAVAAAARA